MQKTLDNMCIKANIDGSKTKQIGGGTGDGTILDKNVEIKTAYQGITKSFQHEFGEKPWRSDIVVFIDISPNCIYLTPFKNFTEKQYKGKEKCKYIFTTKTITWRKECGAFKLDSSVKINEENIKKNNTFKIVNQTNIDELKKFILSKIK
jgi:hypothetical protein